MLLENSPMNSNKEERLTTASVPNRRKTRMTEIPMPMGDDQQRPKKESGGGPCSTKLIAVVIIVIVVGALGFILLSSPGGSEDYQTREIASYNNQDIDLYPTFYRSQFSVSSSETQTSIQPDLLFDIDVKTGSDSVVVTAQIAVYDVDQTTFDTLSWTDLDNNHLVGSDSDTGDVLGFIDLYNYPETYTWVIWFEASSKSDVWDVDIDLTLRYNWVDT